MTGFLSIALILLCIAINITTVRSVESTPVALMLTALTTLLFHGMRVRLRRAASLDVSPVKHNVPNVILRNPAPRSSTRSTLPKPVVKAKKQRKKVVLVGRDAPAKKDQITYKGRSVRVKMISFNVEDDGGLNDICAMRDIISSEHVDILLLQEVPSLQFLHDCEAILKLATGNEWESEMGAYRYGDQIGLLWNSDTVSNTVFEQDLVVGEYAKRARPMLGADFVKDGVHFNAGSIHAQRRASQIRKRQFSYITDYMLQHHRTIIAGDFNKDGAIQGKTIVYNPEYQRVLSSGRGVYYEAPLDVVKPTEKGRYHSVLDGFLLPQGWEGKVKILDDLNSNGSDHYPILLDVLIPAEQEINNSETLEVLRAA